MTSLVAVTTENDLVYLREIQEIEKLSFPSPWSLNALKSEIKNPVSRLWALKREDALSGYICFWMLDKALFFLILPASSIQEPPSVTFNIFVTKKIKFASSF